MEGNLLAKKADRRLLSFRSETNCRFEFINYIRKEGCGLANPKGKKEYSDEMGVQNQRGKKRHVLSVWIK